MPTVDDLYGNRPTVWCSGEEWYVLGQEQDRGFRAVKKGAPVPAQIYLIFVPQMKAVEFLEQRRRANDR